MTNKGKRYAMRIDGQNTFRVVDTGDMVPVWTPEWAKKFNTKEPRIIATCTRRSDALFIKKSFNERKKEDSK